MKEHCASYHSSMSTYRILLALLGAPIAWVTQMSLSETLAAYGCYPHQVPLSAPLWVDLPAILAAISMICLSAGLISGYVAWGSWRRTSHRFAGTETAGSVFEVDGGQTRFLAILGIMSSFVFIVAILFTGCAVLLVPLCSAWT